MYFMDFSPYRKTSQKQASSALYKVILPLLLGGAVLVGFLIFWGVQYWSGGNKNPIFATFQQNDTTAQTQVSGMNVWSRLNDQSFIAEGDRIRITENNGALVLLGNSSDTYFVLGEGVEVLFSSLKENANKDISGSVRIENGSALIATGGDIDSEEKLRIWGSEQKYISLDPHESVLVEGNTVHALQGENILALKENHNGKIELQKAFGIGQSIDMESFSLFATPQKIQNSPLLSLGGSVSHSSVSSGSESSSLASPALVSPQFTGSLISVEGTSQKISGTASNDAEKILVSFTHGDTTEDLFISLSEGGTQAEQEWEYTASTSYGTLKEGVNTYNIYAIDAEGNRSPARVVVLEYKSTEESNVYSEFTGEFLITAPNQGRDATLTGDTLIITGTATSHTAFITIKNTTLGTSYTLQEYKEGQKTWKYWTSSLKPGEYEYVIIATDKNKKEIKELSFSVTLEAEVAPSESPISSASPSPSASVAPSASPLVSPSSSPSPTPAITTSSKEAGRN